MAMSDAEFRAAMEQCALPADAFRHRDHVRLAWIYCRTAGPEAAAALAGRTIRAFAVHHHGGHKYHETITRAWVRLVAVAMRSTPAARDFDTFVAQHPYLLDKDYPRQFYTAELLSSEAARAGWVEPDLAPLP